MGYRAVLPSNIMRVMTMTIEHGLRVPMVGTPQDTGAYAKLVEENGFDFMWVPDTPLLAGLWRDVYMHLTCAALETSKIRLGPGVTNPITRHPVAVGSAIVTLDEVSNGRAEVPYGTGYSSAYIIGRKAATLKLMREATSLWRGIFSGERTQLGGLEIELNPPRAHIPIIMAASGWCTHNGGRPSGLRRMGARAYRCRCRKGGPISLGCQANARGDCLR